MLLLAEIDDEKSTTGALSASGSSCHFCVAHSHSPRPFYSKHHAKLEGKINFLLKSTIRNFISIDDFGLKWEITSDPVFSLYPNLCPEYIGTTESCLQQFLIISC